MSAGSAAPHVALLSLGGTIFMSQDEAGRRAAPDDGNAALLAAQLGGGARLTHRAIANVGSPSIRPAHLREVLAHAEQAVRDGARGVVLTHGTDTLDESGFLLNRYWREDAPLVLTGAMRPANAPGADGPGNVRDAIRTALAPSARGLGVLVVFDGSVHLADRVTKGSTRSLDAFVSEPSGPVGLVGQDDVHLRFQPIAPRPAAARAPLGEDLPRVAVVGLCAGDAGELLEALPTDALDGLVIAGSGMGHVAADAAPRLGALVARGVPVVIATRIPRGGTSTHHYDYPGSEVDLISRGCAMAGDLPPHQARNLLRVLLADGAGADEIRAAFAAFSS